ncbi:PH [Phytophthora citrophthora]|uniref:PH n=1 Tax=Phytophthora citrophthora TaxID=4793 RepID=A0AAD9LN73_9STRA|nr:PH [Phytophthora citrophthora]
MPSRVMADRTPPRLSGTIWKRNAGLLRAWHSRTAVVTAEGILIYKKKADGGKTKEIDLVKATFAASIVQSNGYYHFELQYGPNQASIGFPTVQEARLWLSGMMEAADENSTGRRAWVANLRRMMTLNLRDRRQLVPAMADRDWFSEWNFCLRSLKNDREPFAARQRRLRRLHTIWLQFELFTEILAEIFFSSVQQRDAQGLARIESFERAASDFALSGGQQTDFSQTAPANLAPHPSLLSTASTSSTVSSTQGNDSDLGVNGLTTRRDDVDEMKLAGIHLEFASKSWQGHKRLSKETALFAKFRSLIELFLSESASENGKLPSSLLPVLSKLPSFPLVSAFSIRGVSVVAIAEPLRTEKSILTTIDNRDLAGLTMVLREAKMLRYFPYEELPELVVRKLPGNAAPTLVRVHPRYDNVLVNSLRSSMMHGILIRTMSETNRLEILSAHDVLELVGMKRPKWVPYLDLVYYELDTEPSPAQNLAAMEFLLKSEYTSPPLTGDVVIAVDTEKSKLQLDLPEAFVKKYNVDIHPLVRKLQNLKKNSAIFAVATSSQTFIRSQSHTADPSVQVAREYEDAVKKLLVQHIKNFSAQLITLGDAAEPQTSGFGRSRAPTWSQSQWSSSRARLTRSNTMSSMPRPEDLFSSAIAPDFQRSEFAPISQPPLRRRMSSLSSMAQTLGTGGLDTNAGTYIIDTLHLRQAMREGGVNVRFLPLVFQYLNGRDQLGVQVLVASEIIARLAKNLFRYRMLNEDTKKSRWKSRKSRLIKFIDSILHGLFHKNLQCPIQECSGDQFWDVDGPVMYSLGVFSTSFALDPKAQKEVGGNCLDKYRDLLKVNPPILFNSLLHVFQARLTKSILPELRENRFVSVPFLRTEHDLTFNYEEDDPKLALKIHQDLLWSHLQFFRVQFDALKPELPMLNQIKPTEPTTWTQYYGTLSQIFRQNLNLPILSRLEKAIQSWQDLTAVRAHLSLALRAAAPFHPSENSKTSAIIREHCSFAYLRMASSKALFPIEYKLALRCLELVGSGEELATAMESSDELLEWLRFFYRPANPSQFLKGSSSHPVYSIQYSTDNEFEGSMVSVRNKFQRQQSRESWMSVMPNVDAYCRRIEAMRRDPVAVAATRAVLCEMGFASRPSEPLSPRESSDKYESTFSFNPEDSMMPSSMYSSRGDALWFIECFFLPPLANNSLLVAGDALVNNEEISSRLTSVKVDFDEGISVPGLALVWGSPLGLSLDEEAHISDGAPAATLSLRPTSENVSGIRMASFPPPLRRVVQISCGYRHTALITDDRHLYTFGHGECGRLGHGTEEDCLDPRPVVYFSSLIAAEGVGIGGIVDVSCGREHTMAVTANGKLFAFGWGEAGRLGTGETGSSLYPSRVELTNISTVACGREHTLALTRKGRVFAFGAGFGGRLGNGSERDEELPSLVEDLEDYRIAAIDAGECHSVALSREGDVLTWGFGASGALGHGNRENQLKPKLVVGLNTPVTAIACGSYHTLAATSDVLYGWGDAAAGQLGAEHATDQDQVVLSPKTIRIPTSSGIRGITCGTFTSAVCTNQGHLFLWGSPAAGNGASLDMENARVKRIGVLGEFSFSQIACAPNDSSPQVLPQLRPKRPSARGVLSPPRATHAPRSTRLSDSATNFLFARLVELLLYFWTVAAGVLGIILACLVLYLMYFKDGGDLAPKLPFNLAAYGGLIVSIASFFGLYGLINHRKLVTLGRRNYTLGTFVLVGAIGAIIVIIAGAMAISFTHIVELAQEEVVLSDRVAVFESGIISRLDSQVLKSSSIWRETQDALECCGYEPVSVGQEHFEASWSSSLQISIQEINAIGGRYCNTRSSECEEAVNEANCPVPGRNWCRMELLDVIRDNFSLLSICAIVFGAVQLLFSGFGLFTLLCDVRRLAGSSPTKPVVRLKYHEKEAFLEKESFKGLTSTEDLTLQSAWFLGTVVGEAYRVASTIYQASYQASQETRPVSWGYGHSDGALGHNNTRRVVEAKRLAFFRRSIIRAVSAGNRLSLFLTDDNRIFQAGRLFMKQDGCKMWKPSEIKPENEKKKVNFVAVGAGYLAAYAIDDQGRVYSWGSQIFGQLGHGEDLEQENVDEIPSEIPEEEEQMNQNQEDEEEEESLPKVVIVERMPRLIEGLNSHSVVKISAGNHFVVAITTTGAVFSWGRGTFGQLGNGQVVDTSVPSRIEALADYTAIDLAAGMNHVVGVFIPRGEQFDHREETTTERSIVMVWGRGQHGCLGLGGSKNELLPCENEFFRGLAAVKVAAGSDHSLVLCAAGAQTFLYAFGRNHLGQLGIASSADHVDMPTFLDEFVNVHVADIGAGAQYSAALTGDGEVFTWGDARYGKTCRADGRTTYVPWRIDLPSNISSSSYITQLSVGSHHSLAQIRIRGIVDRWRKFPLGGIVPAINNEESKAALTAQLAVFLASLSTVKRAECYQSVDVAVVDATQATHSAQQ